ncbi:unnamed protein product [Eruca vesicaria subsp. sativa]|uniref:Uncharacterized protein n=1 Tax=Eruca vesicaria subsp. sativa TaxID=29727 RepID=A0ABC8K711_ERUVS|nr:unnamed protein product [Eruca vesicaria subsp. sativa]
MVPLKEAVGNEELQDELEQEDGAESSNRGAGNLTDRAVEADQAEVNQVRKAAEPSMREVLDAVVQMGTQMLALTQAFTPLVNSSVGQVNPGRPAERTAELRAGRPTDLRAAAAIGAGARARAGPANT